MGAEAQTLPKPSEGPPKRRLRNYLLDPRFQLKYTGMVVGVTLVVASVLGYLTYDMSTAQTEVMTANALANPDLQPEAMELIIAESEKHDGKVLLGIIGGIITMVLALGFTGIIVTHKLVGPAYKLRMLLNKVGDGKLKLFGRLRKGDELQELFEAFANMVESLRHAQAREISELDAAIESARESGVSEEQLAKIIEVRDRMQESLN